MMHMAQAFFLPAGCSYITSHVLVQDKMQIFLFSTKISSASRKRKCWMASRRCTSSIRMSSRLVCLSWSWGRLPKIVRKMVVEPEWNGIYYNKSYVYNIIQFILLFLYIYIYISHYIAMVNRSSIRGCHMFRGNCPEFIQTSVVNGLSPQFLKSGTNVLSKQG